MTKKSPSSRKKKRQSWQAWVLYVDGQPGVIDCMDEHDPPGEYHHELPVYRTLADAQRRGPDVRRVTITEDPT